MGCAGPRELSHILYQEKSFFSASFHSKKEKNNKEMKSNYCSQIKGKDLVFYLMIGGDLWVGRKKGVL
jgi:hypothetical protein